MIGMFPRDFSSIDRKSRMKIESHGLPLRPAEKLQCGVPHVSVVDPVNGVGGSHQELDGQG